jgi:Protein of unknown function (DUF2490)
LRVAYRIIIGCLFLLASNFTFAQNNKFGTWNIVNTKLNLDKNWAVFNELQLRSQLFYGDFYYYEIKGGISYSINKNFSVLAGTGRYMTYSNGGDFNKPFVNKEFRTWQQITMNNYLDRVKFEHRYRLEQRWLSNGGYRNRFRYRLNTFLPINNKKIEPHTFYLTAFDEIFLTNVAPYFERNRILGGAGYQFSKHLTLQTGYVYQFDYRANNTKAGKSYLQLAVLIELNAHKNPREKIPGSED